MAKKRKTTKKKAARTKPAARPRPARGGAESTAAVTAAIARKHFTWVASDNPVQAMSREQQDAMLGYRADEKELDSLKSLISSANDFQHHLTTGPLASPAYVDWRANNGNWTTAVRDQRTCGSCVSFATLATIEARVKIQCKDASLQPDYAESFLFFCGCGNCCGSGWNFAPALDFCQNRGIAEESSWPYQPSDQPCRSDVPVIGKINSWRRALSMEERFDSLARYGPMVAGMQVYADFFSYTSGVYRRTSNASRGYHAISVVGYDKTQECWICKNSWGTGWGESGYFRIGFGESDIDTRFPFYEVHVACLAPVQPSEACRQYVPYLVRVIQVARANRSFGACVRYHVCRRGPRPIRCTEAYLRVIRSVLEILRRCPQYRAPFCRAIG